MTWTRRVFLKETLGGWLALVIAPGGYALFRRWLSRDDSRKIGEVELGPIEHFESGTSRTVMMGVEKVLVVRTIEGTFYAVSSVCTHLGCSIRLEQSGGRSEFACNCHDSRFDLDGVNLSGPAPGPLERFRVEAKGKEIRLVRLIDNDRL